MVGLYLDYGLDESYTPASLSLYVGTASDDLTLKHTLQVSEPVGWVELWNTDGTRGWCVKVEVGGMHQNGRDTHVRQVRVWGERGGGRQRMEGNQMTRTIKD